MQRGRNVLSNQPASLTVKPPYTPRQRQYVALLMRLRPRKSSIVWPLTASASVCRNNLAMNSGVVCDMFLSLFGEGGAGLSFCLATISKSFQGLLRWSRAVAGMVQFDN